MAVDTVILQGVVKADGTLDLPGAVALPPGPVEVAVRSLAQPGGEDIVSFLTRIHAEQRARGYVPRTAAEIDAEVQRSRDEWEEHSRAIEQLQEECQRAREKRGRAAQVIVFLDTNIVIYLVENPPGFGSRAAARIAAHRAAGDSFAVSDVVRLECRVLPIRLGNLVLVRDYDAFFRLPDVRVMGLTADVCDRAALVRARHSFKTIDALQLASAIVHGCDRFLTNDTRLAVCADIPIDVLP